jgi:hypothetical protein
LDVGGGADHQSFPLAQKSDEVVSLAILVTIPSIDLVIGAGRSSRMVYAAFGLIPARDNLL